MNVPWARCRFTGAAGFVLAWSFAILPACDAPADSSSGGQAAAASSEPTAPPRTTPRLSAGSLLIPHVPHVRQKPDFCGEACAEMALRAQGRPIDQDAVFNAAGVDPLLGRGCHAPELATALKKIGFDIGPTWYSIPVASSQKALEAQWQQLRADLQRGVPSIVCMHYSTSPGASEHFRLVLGHDVAKDEVIYHEPAEVNGAYRRMKRRDFLAMWPLKYRRDRWTVIRMPLKPRRLPAATPTPAPRPNEAFTKADYAQHVRALRTRVPKGFTIVLAEPFVVIGDEAPDRVRSRAARTIQWAVRLLKKDYFTKDPAKIIDVWLFKGKASYEKYTWALFKTKPFTPYGYFSSQHNALVMNIATGGGTLVHEMVHPFIASNFPQCPSWFDEGLASLYEQCNEVGGKIVGLTNWRLAGLQKAIRARRVPAFQTLCSTTRHQFYEEDRGTNYAQARYLCYYLQQRGLLRTYYHQFHKNHKTDPTGYKTLVKILGVRDMAAFQKAWEAWILKLRFP